MNRYRTLTRLAVLAIAVGAALPALAETSVTVERGRHHYVYYSDKDIYYAPDTHRYYWLEDGRWRSGERLPAAEQDYVVRAKGIDIDLDTDTPYERNDYVVAHYGPPRETSRTERTVNADGSTTTTTTTTKRQYVYYDRGIYFAPDTRTYYWQDNGRWISGTTLPPTFEPYVRSGGVNIELDTDRPYERNAYVIAHYGHRQHVRHDDDDDDD